MPAGRLNDSTIVLGAGALIVALGAFGAIVAPAPDAAQGTSSSYSSGPAGARAAYLTLKRLGYQVERSIEPMTALTADPASSVLILSGVGESSKQDRRALDVFLKAGGVVLAIGAPGAEFLGVTSQDGKPAPTFGPEQVNVHRAIAASPLIAGATEITMAAAASAVPLGNAYVTLYGEGTPVVASAAIGKGRAIWWAAATPLSNDHIAEAGNLRLLLNVLGPPGSRRIIWDEHYHGYTRSLWSYIVRTPLAWVLLQIGLIGCAAALTYSRQHGPIRAVFEEPRTSPIEFVDMLGTLYKRAGASAAAVSAAGARLRRTIVTASGLPSHSPDRALAHAAAARLATDPAPLESLLAESDSAAGGVDLSPARALSLIQRLQSVTGSILKHTSPAPVRGTEE